MESHEAADIFPMMDDEDFAAFKQDIKENGQKEPIVTYEGKIIDGRNRYRACTELNIQPMYVEWDGKGSLTEFVVSLNLHRRHLNTTQKAMLGVKIRESLTTEAEARSRANLKKGNSLETAILGESPDGQISAPRGRTADIAARIVGTSSQSVKAMARIKETGDKELMYAVNAGQVSLEDAAEIAKLAPEDRHTVIATGEEGMKEKAQELRQQRANASKPSKTPESSCLVEKGVKAVTDYMNKKVEEAARFKEPISPERFFALMTEMRYVLVGI